MLLVAFISGCSTWGEHGEIWCNYRYRTTENWTDATGKAAVKGYMYALAAALVLQKEDPDDTEAKDHHFARPERLEVIDSPIRKSSGFEVTTFKLKKLYASEDDQIIIAFAGSNDRSDWISTNLNPFGRAQYDEATAYARRMLQDPRVKGKQVILTGISLGGGLAIHVLKNAELEPYISQVWALNPSPKIYSPQPATLAMRRKTWLGYSDGEILTWGRSSLMRWLIRGSGPIEPAPNQTAVFNLIESNRIYAHFRWGIARQMLWIADYELTRQEKDAWTEPLYILQKSHFTACQPDLTPSVEKQNLKPKGPPPDYSGNTLLSK